MSVVDQERITAGIYPCSETIDMITKTGEALFGGFWRRQLSEALGYAGTCSSLRRWLDGETSLPRDIPGRLNKLLDESKEKVERIIARINAQLEEQKSRPISGKFEEIRNVENLENLEEIGLLLFGEMWEKALAESIGYSRWGVRAWRKKKRNTPEVLPWLLCRLLEQRLSMMNDAQKMAIKKIPA